MKVNIHYLNQEKSLNINYDYINSPFGEMLLMCNNDKICFLGFVNSNIYNKEDVFNIAQKSFRNLLVSFVKSDLSTNGKKVFSVNSLDILLIGTSFQIKVWESLIKVKKGKVISYEGLAKQVEDLDKNVNYTRAVANAVAKNKISYIIPCHRVISKSGSLHRYLWGSELKRKILKYEGINFK